MGKFIEWSEVLSVGIDEIDAQHRVLVDLINEMHDAIHQRHEGGIEVPHHRRSHGPGHARIDHTGAGSKQDPLRHIQFGKLFKLFET